MEFVFELGRRERKRQALHQTVLDAAERLFRERGVTRTTVEEIAAAADVARQTVFNHFPYKEALVLEVTAKDIRDVADRAHALLEAGVPALEVLQRVAEWVVERAVGQGEMAAIVAQELLHPDPERARRAADVLPFTEIFEALLVQAREEGEVRGDLPLDIVASRLSAVFRSVLLQIAGCDRERLQRELSICFDMVFNGIKDRRL